MAAPEDDADEPVPDDPESRFLIALWDCLEPAYELSTTPTAIRDLPEIQGLCERAVDMIRGYRGA